MHYFTAVLYPRYNFCSIKNQLKIDDYSRITKPQKILCHAKGRG